MTQQAGLWFLGACFFAVAFAHDLWRGKTIFFPLATIEREDSPTGFWLAEGFAVLLSLSCVYQAWWALAG